MRIDYPGGRFFTFEYYASGQRKNRTDHDGNVVNYIYDTLGRLDQMTDTTGALIVAYDYDLAGRLELKTLGNAVYTTYDYDDAGRLEHLVNHAPDDTAISRFDYTYDGNMTAKTEGGVTTAYTYDVENRLIGVSTPTDTWTYTYDAFGDRIASTHNSVTTHYVVDPWGLGDVAAEYDGTGALIARYDHGFGLLSRTDASSNPAYYTFDAIGNTRELTGNTGSPAEQLQL